MIRRLRHRQPSMWFVLAAVLATIAAIATMRAAATNGAMATVVVAARDLPYGANLDESTANVRELLVPRDGVLPGMVQRPSELAGRSLSVPVRAGEPITQASLGGEPGVAPEPLRRGERAISVPRVAAGAAIAALVPGARVDVIASSDSGEARLVVARAEVIAQTIPNGADAVSDGGAVLLRVTAKGALDLSAALDGARGVRLLPRPTNDEGEDVP